MVNGTFRSAGVLAGSFDFPLPSAPVADLPRGTGFHSRQRLGMAFSTVDPFCTHDRFRVIVGLRIGRIRVRGKG
jgi:hypothetical protein